MSLPVRVGGCARVRASACFPDLREKAYFLSCGLGRLASDGTWVGSIPQP